MPTSAPYAIPTLLHATRQIQPRSILDVGTGFGKFGFLFREYTDIWNAQDADEMKPASWQTRIDGVEVFPEYLTPVHEYVYDHVYIGNILDLIDGLGQYDMVFMGDVLEHFHQDEGHVLVRKLFDHTRKCLVLAYPTNSQIRDAVRENEAEAHHSQWSRNDFDVYENIGYTTIEDRADVCAIARSPEYLPFLVGCFAARRRTGWKGRVASTLVRLVGPSRASHLISRFVGESVVLRAE